uniref:Uncharacterized protein n=1 Tax=Pararge aegeria TaxID=116150 RepID=S4PRI7_9NEOP
MIWKPLYDNATKKWLRLPHIHPILGPCSKRLNKVLPDSEDWILIERSNPQSFRDISLYLNVILSRLSDAPITSTARENDIPFFLRHPKRSHMISRAQM